MRDLHVSHDSEIRSLIVIILEKTRVQIHPAQIWTAHDGIRTRDLFLTKEVLYRLSYMGIPAQLSPGQSIKTPAIKFPATRLARLDSFKVKSMERETGLEPATPSLEGSRSTN